MIGWRVGLSGVALNIASSNDSPIRVMAGPGTGKSFAMMRRIARLLEEGQEPSRILAVTFTRNAALALIDDIHSLNVAGSEEIHAGTLHAYCYNLLMEGDVFNLIGRIPRTLIAPTVKRVLKFEAEPLLFDIKDNGDFGGRRECSIRIKAFEAAWARRQSDQPGWPAEAIDKEFHVELIMWLNFHKAIFIGELVPETLRFLRNNPAHPALSAFDHVIVDEYQDLNRAEQELIDLLSSAGANAIVGDVDQSIYSFRYAHPEGIVQFDASHPNTHDENLIECRRCPTNVVEIADSLIRHNHGQVNHRRLTPMHGNVAGQVHIVQWSTIDDESDGLADYVKWLVDNNPYEAGDILLLTPRRLLGYGIRDALKDRGVPVHSFFHENILMAIAAQRAFTLLTLIVNPEDRVALRWWLGEGSPSTRKGEYFRLRAYCESTGESPWEALSGMVSGRINIQRTTNILEKFRNLCNEMNGLRSLSLPALVDNLFPDGDDSCAVLRETALFSLTDSTTAEELFTSIHSSITQPEMPKAGDFVRVMSLHKSKGLTSKVVIVADCIKGLIPFIDNTKSDDEQRQDLEEQRRLFYVALTRCREILVLSSVATMERKIGHQIGASLSRGTGLIGATIASPFINELGATAPVSISGSRWRGNGWT
ncbi:ATP-dependent helicase [Candidatus Neomarinimicrobiota bacterium]